MFGRVLVQTTIRPARDASVLARQRVTRSTPSFHGPRGAFVDVANAYLQPPHQDIEPVPGQLLLFPSWLAHPALPYDGAEERIIISFNASIHASKGDQMHGYSAH